MNKFPLYFSYSIFSLSKGIRDHRKIKRSFSKLLQLFPGFYGFQLTSLASVLWGLRKCNDSTNDLHDWWTFWQMLLSTKTWLLWAQMCANCMVPMSSHSSTRAQHPNGKCLFGSVSNTAEPNVGKQKPFLVMVPPLFLPFLFSLIIKKQNVSKIPHPFPARSRRWEPVLPGAHLRFLGSHNP